MDPERQHCEDDARSAFRLAGSFLLPVGTGAESASPRWSRVGVWLPVWGLLIGAAYAGIFRGLWLWLGEYQQIRLAPMAMLLAVDVCWLGYRPLAAAAAIVAGWRERTAPAGGEVRLPAVVFVAAAVVVKFALLVALPAGAVTWPADWRENLRFVYPYVIYRPLVLMPLWGRWAVYLASNIGRVAPGSPRRLELLGTGGKLTTVMAWWLAITVLTVLYASPAVAHIGWAMLISLGMLLVGYLGSFTLARRFAGQNEATILAAGWVVELAFLLAYLPVARSIYWY